MQAKVAWLDVMHLLSIRHSRDQGGLMENAEKDDTKCPPREGTGFYKTFPVPK